MSNWISVKDRLPNIDRSHGHASVIVYCPLWGVYMANARFVSESNFVVWTDWHDKSCVPPTHWMPLPELPKP